MVDTAGIDGAALVRSPVLVDAVLAYGNDVVLFFQGDGTIVWASPSAERIFGLAPEDLVGRNGFSLIHAEDRDEAFLRMAGAAAAGDQVRVEFRIVAADGTTRWVEELVTNLLDAPDVGVVVAHLRDITEQVHRRRAAEEDARRLADAQASAHLGSFEIDLASGEVHRSEEMWRILGREPGSLVGHGDEVVHPDDREAVSAAHDALAAGGGEVSVVHRIVRPAGDVRWVISRSRLVEGGTVLRGTALDITERYEDELRLVHQATHDPLTGLANRRLFVQTLEAELERGVRTAVLYVDLDDFKAVNDRLGHVDGDAVIRAVGQRVAAAVPEGTVGRLGGDELVVCVPSLLGSGPARQVAERVQRAVAAPVLVGDEEHLITASIGVALSAPDSRAEVLLREADMAMYAAKQAGRGRIEQFDHALHERTRRRAELAAELAAAIEAGEVGVHFQPEVSLADGQLVGFEALARWDHPTRGRIPPDEFIPLAEEAGAIHALGRRVLAEACRALAGWRRHRPDLALGVAVNVSPVQLADPSFPDEVRACIEAAGVPAGQVCLEVTESTLMDVEVARVALDRLAAVGVAIAIDDFGTGYSSLSRLKRFPVTFLKVDRSFVAGLGVDPFDEAIVAAVVGLAGTLGLRVIAEGVETEEQAAALAALGCPLGQGFLWGRPVDAEAAAALIRA